MVRALDPVTSGRPSFSPSLPDAGGRRGLGRGGAFSRMTPLSGSLPARSSRGERANAPAPTAGYWAGSAMEPSERFVVFAAFDSSSDAEENILIFSAAAAPPLLGGEGRGEGERFPTRISRYATRMDTDEQGFASRADLTQKASVPRLFNRCSSVSIRG